MPDYSPEYAEHFSRGPFPGRIDPWSEIGYFFQQIHANIIGLLQRDLQKTLSLKGYIIGRETSLQIAGGSEPDLTIKRQFSARDTMKLADYAAAAAALAVETGVEVVDEHELQALYVREISTHQLVTVVELISPGNKDRLSTRYRQYRAFLLEEGVNFVELDLTRSIQRMLESRVTRQYPYHIAIYLPEEPPLVIGVEFNQPLKPFALPLRHEAVAIETQSFYDQAYRDAAIAGHIEYEQRYTERDLPFPSTLTPAQREYALQEAGVWLEKLYQLRHAARNNK